MITGISVNVLTYTRKHTSTFEIEPTAKRFGGYTVN